MATRYFKTFAIGAALLILLAACSDDNEESADSGGAPRPEPVEGRPGRVAFDVGSQGGGSAATGVDQAFLPEDNLAIGPSVIKTADLRIKIGSDALQDALDDAIAIANREGGFVVSSEVNDDEQGHASLVVRVPADRFEQTLADLGDLGDVERESVAGEDVSQEFIDLEARLRNASAQEAVLLRLMDRSQTIADTIRVQRVLQQVQLEIERLRGRIRFLEDRTTFGTILIGFIEGGVPQPSDPSTFARAWDIARETFANVLGGVVIGAAVVIPVGFMLAVVVAAGMLIYRRLRPRFATPFK